MNREGTEGVRRPGGFDPAAHTKEEALAQVVMANRILAREGIFDYLGHVSIRNPEERETFLIARSLAPEMVTPRDIFTIDLEGKVLTESTLSPCRERIIHGAIYGARPDVNAVLHAHPLQLIILASLGLPVRPIAHFACKLSGEIPVYDEYDFTSPGATGMLVTTPKEGRRLARRLGGARVMIMRGHGVNVVAPTIPELVQLAVTLRDNVTVQLAAHQIGTPAYLTEEEARRSQAAFIGIGVERGWHYWVTRAKQAYGDL